MDEKLRNLIGKKITKVQTIDEAYMENQFVITLDDGTIVKFQYEQNEGSLEINGVRM